MRTRRLLAASVACALALVACADDDDDDAGTATTTPAASATDSAPATGGSAPAGGDQEVVVGAVLEPTSLDIVTVDGAALDQILLDNIYETLLKLDETGEIGPGLAAMPEVSEDGTVYTFTLQEGVTFHSGEPLTSADVVWSLDAQRAEGANESERLAGITSVEAPDESTVVVTLSEPDNDFLFGMTRRAGAVLQADATGLENSANGTGPFTFVEWNVGSSITLARNDAYWSEPPSIGGLTFLYFTDPNAAVNAFTTGDVDILTGVNTDLVGPLQENPDYVVNEGTTNGEFTLGMNNGREPFSNPDVRKAVRQAIDKEGYKELNNGFGTLIGGPVPPTDPWYEDLTGLVPYDPDAARAALEAAGHGAGLDITLLWPNFYPITNAEYVASQLGEVGINVTIEPVEFSVWLEQAFTNKDYDMTAVLHVEARDISNYANPDYYWQYDNPDVQQLIGDAKVSTDEDEAVELLKQAARQIAEDSPVDWLILAPDLTVSTPDITGYPTNDTASRFDASGITVSG
jgi:peptide/nickel transport system substrate-binding protein